MKQASQIVIMGHEGIRLTITLKAINEQQESWLLNEAVGFYKSLVYQLNKEDELERDFYGEQNLNVDLEDDLEYDEDSPEDEGYTEDYEFDYLRFK
ncbi:MAG: hypothetical protein M3Q05_02850 [Bacteroidota bacterium]|nr:hypothetical protein [Bacteroidota bacterium]